MCYKMDVIVGREEEKAQLNKIMKSSEACFLAVYGRRRVGKTFLIRQFFGNAICFYLSGQKDAPLKTQLENFTEEYNSRNKNIRDKIVKPILSWSEAFAKLSEYLEKIGSKKQKCVVFIDEMPWLDGDRSKFKSALDYFWNRHVSSMNNVLLIACGSSTSWIKANLISATGGLYKRVTHRMKLSPFTLGETEYFFKKKGLAFNRKTILDIYMIFGGIPHYLKEIDKFESVPKIIGNLCFSTKGLMYDEYNILFESLFENAAYHKSVVEIMSKHHYGMNQTMILEKLDIAQSTLSRTLLELEESNFITKFPAFKKQRKDFVYRITDPFTLFYNKFMKNQKVVSKTKWENLSNTQSYKIWCGYTYENICHSHIDGVLHKLGITGIVTSAYSWIYRGDEDLPGVQIDLLIDRSDNCINICEIKYSSEDFILSKDQLEKMRKRKSIFNAVVNNKKQIFTTLITVGKPLENANYHQEVHSSVILEDLFSVKSFS